MVCVCFRRGRNSSSVRPASPNYRLGKTCLHSPKPSRPAPASRNPSSFPGCCGSRRLDPILQRAGTDLPVEALKEVRKLARYEGDDPDVVRLKALFASLAGATGMLH